MFVSNLFVLALKNPMPFLQGFYVALTGFIIWLAP